MVCVDANQCINKTLKVNDNYWVIVRVDCMVGVSDDLLLYGGEGGILLHIYIYDLASST